MKRIIVVYNPRSSRFNVVRQEVLDKLNTLQGYLIGKYEVEPTDVDKNAEKLAKLLKDDDLVISAGGDATGVIASSAILKSAKNAILAVLPYGNFNDLSRTLGVKDLNGIFDTEFGCQSLYPLEIYVDGKFFRYATCYVTIGMMAEAVHIYDQPKMRKILKTKRGRDIGSYTNLASWYFKHRHKKQFLPDFKLNGVLQPKKTSDYASINGRYMARVMRGGDYYKTAKTFRSKTDRLTNFWRLFKLMAKSILFHIPGTDTKNDILEFLEPATVELQAEGEYKTLENVKTIEIRKGKQCLQVIAKN